MVGAVFEVFTLFALSTVTFLELLELELLLDVLDDITDDVDLFADDDNDVESRCFDLSLSDLVAFDNAL